MFWSRYLPIIAPLLASAAAELTVAIYGGGVASATLAQALKDQKNLNIQYYDPALNLTPTSFRLLGLSPKAWTALDLVGDEAGGAINRAGWYPEDPSLVIVVSYPAVSCTIHPGVGAELCLRVKARMLGRWSWTMAVFPTPRIGRK